jgi:hypothetical protein
LRAVPTEEAKQFAGKNQGKQKVGWWWN